MKKLLLITLLSIICLLACKEPRPKENVIIDSLNSYANVVIPKKDSFQILSPLPQKDFKGAKSYKISGKLISSLANEDFSIYQVLILDTNGVIIKQIKAKKDGSYAFRKLESGNYNIALDSINVNISANVPKIEKEVDVLIKEEIVDKFQIGTVLTQKEVNERLLNSISKDSLTTLKSNVVNGKITIVGKTKNAEILTVFLVNSANKILKKIDLTSDKKFKLTALKAYDYKIIQKVPDQNIKASIDYVYDKTKIKPQLEVLKTFDQLSPLKLKELSIYAFKSDTLQDGTFIGQLEDATTNQQLPLRKIHLVNKAGLVIKEILTDEHGLFEFSKLPKAYYHIVVAPKTPKTKVSYKKPIKIEEKAPAVVQEKAIEEMLAKPLKTTSVNKVENVKKIESVNEQINTNNNDALLFYQRGIMKMEMGEYSSATEDFNKVVELKPDYTDAYMHLGDCKDFLGDYEAALENYTHVLTFSPNDIPAFYKRAIVKNEIGEYLSAIEDLDKVIELYPSYNYPYFYRGVAKNHLRRYEDALKDYDKMLELSPNVSEGHFNKGATYFEMGKYKESITSYTKAIEIEPEDAEAHLHRGQAYSAITDFINATKDFDQAIKIKPDLKEAYYEKATMKYALGDITTANNTYNEVVNKFKEDYEVYYHRSIFFLNTEEYAKAKQDLDEGIKLYDKDPEMFYQRAKVNQKLKNKDQICPDLKKAKELGYTDAANPTELETLTKKYCD